MTPTDALVRAVSALVAASALATVATAPPRGRAARDPRARLADAIERATGLHASPEGVVFETREPLGLRDAVLGRPALLAASERPAGPRDVWRVRVRVSPDGSLLALRGPVNLTDSALGDDGPLTGADGRVAFPTRAFGVVQSVSTLDTAGGGAVTWRRGVTNALATLSWRGVARCDLRFDRPADAVSATFDGASLGVRAGARAWRVDLARATVTPPEGASLSRQASVEKPLVHWVVDTVRGLPWVGPAPIAWLEERAFGARDLARRCAFRWFGVRPADGSAAASEPDAPAVTAGRAIERAHRDEQDAHWPPADLDPPLAGSLGRSPGEGVWTDATPAWLRRNDGAPPAFYRAWVRLDAERPYARVVLVAFDLRQVSLGMQAGVEDPVPLVGPRGDGRIPRDPDLLGRVVGAFNGAFKTEHGQYGMVVDRRVLLPPRPRAATVATLDDGRVAMGTWGASSALPPSVVSLRQNLDPLLADGVENPARRAQWGFVLGGVERMPTVRSGLCVDAHGAAMYAWGEETTGRMLGRAMRLAGCTYGMHLDMNPGHAAFHFLRVDDVAARRYRYQTLTAAMHSGGDRFLYYTLKDFFYLALRPLRPAAVAGAAWEPLARQPHPRWAPALLSARVGAVTLTSIALDRVSLRLRAGRREPLAREHVGQHDTLAAHAAAAVLGALELGAARDAQHPRGLAVDGRVLLPFARAEGLGRLELAAAGPRIARASEPSDEAGDAIEGRVIVDAGAAVAVNDDVASARVALGLTGDGRLLVAEGDCDVAALQAALVAAGAASALLLDAGAAPFASHWDDVRDAYLGSALFVTAAEAPPPVARLEPLVGAPPDAAVAPARGAR